MAARYSMHAGLRLWHLCSLWLALFCLLPCMSRAQLAAGADGAPRWEHLADPVFAHLSLEQGLPHQLVMALAQDRSGFLWLGTQGGLARWDGYRFRAYLPQADDPYSMPDNSIQSLHTDRQGHLWIGTSTRGLVRYDAQSERFLRLPVGGSNGIRHVLVNTICDADGEGIWVGSRGGLDLVRAQQQGGISVLHMQHDPADSGSLPSDEIRSLLRDSKGRLWIGTRKGLVWRDPRSGKLHPLSLVTGKEPGKEPGKESDKEPAIRALTEDAKGRIWIGSIGLGVFMLDPLSLQPQVLPDADGKPLQIDATSIEDDGNGKIWIGTFAHGLLLVDAATLQVRHLLHDPALPQGLSNDTIVTMLRDRSGLLWLGTQRGLSRHDPGQTAVLNLFGSVKGNNHIGDPDVRSVLPLADGSVMLGLQAQGISMIDRSLSHISTQSADPGKPDLAMPLVRASLQSAPGTVYLGTDRGLFRTDPAGNAPKRLILPPLDPSRIVFALVQDEGKVWLGGGDGLWQIDAAATRAERVAGTEALSKETVTTLARGRQGQLWVGTRTSGIYRFDAASGRLLHFAADASNKAALPSANIASLLFDSRGWLWVGALGGGISLLRDNNVAASRQARFVHYGVAQGLPNEVVDQLLEDNAGRIWASTDRGLAMIDPASGKIRALQRADGVAIPDYWSNSGAKSAQGALLFGGAGGLTVVRPELLGDWRFDAPVVVTGIMLGGKAVASNRFNPHAARTGTAEPALLLISPEANSLTVEFSALDFSAPEHNRYAYRLDGYDQDWIDTEPQRRLAAYTNLPPGDYRLRLRGSNRNGNWSRDELTLPVRVLPDWHQSNWFRASLLLLAALAVLALVQVRTRYLRQQQRVLQHEVELRTRELSEKQQELMQANQEMHTAIIAANHSNTALNQANDRLAQSVTTLRQLGDIGREITANLDAGCVFQALHRSVEGLLDAPTLMIYRMADHGVLELEFGHEGDTLMALHEVAFDDPRALVAQVARERKPLLLEAEPGQGIDGTRNMLSALFYPLAVDQRLLGVMSIQSPRPLAYGETECLIFRTLCAYGAIALDNAHAYRQVAATLKTLGETQAQLVQQAKIASLGTLTAGVAHEINNPANFAYVGSYNLRQQLAQFHEFLLELAGLDAPPELLDSLQQRFAQLGESLDAIAEGATRIRDLVRDLRTFSRLDEADWKEVAIGDSLNATVNLVRMQYAHQVEIICKLDANPLLTCWPAQLNQVFMNLIVNACQAIAARPEARKLAEPGRLEIHNQILDDCLLLEFIDNGTGMSDATLQQIFDPFYTTKGVGEGMGMGLSIVLSIIEKHQGKIDVHSTPGQGSRFELRLPLVMKSM